MLKSEGFPPTRSPLLPTVSWKFTHLKIKVKQKMHYWWAFLDVDNSSRGGFSALSERHPLSTKNAQKYAFWRSDCQMEESRCGEVTVQFCVRKITWGMQPGQGVSAAGQEGAGWFSSTDVALSWTSLRAGPSVPAPLRRRNSPPGLVPSTSRPRTVPRRREVWKAPGRRARSLHESD